MKDKKIENINDNIKSYLDFYLENEPLGYGILINGDWGAGKTYFIKKYLLDSGMVKASLKQLAPFDKAKKCFSSLKWYFVSLKKEASPDAAAREVLDDIEEQHDHVKQYVYISLYGLKSSSEINEAITSQLLFFGNENFSKLANGAFNSLKSFIKFNTKFSLNDLSSLSSRIYLYVFDDLERYEGDLNEVLGYLNSLVEHKGARLIVLANESEINNAPRYYESKEKLIGKSLTLKPDFESAFSSFLKKVEGDPVFDFLEEYSKNLEFAFNASEKKNLRAFRQTVMEFKSFYNALLNTGLENRKLAFNHLMAYFIIAFEYQLGVLKKEDIEKRILIRVHLSLSREKGYVDDSFDNMESRHSGVSFRDNVFSMNVVFQAIVNSWLDTDLLSKELSSPPFKEALSTAEEWRVLWFWDSYDEGDFNATLSTFEDKLNNLVYDDFGIIIHAFGIKISLSNDGLIEDDHQEILRFFKKYIDSFFSKLDAYEYFEDQLIIDFYGSHVLEVLRDSAYGLGFLNRTDACFIEFADYLNVSIQESIESTFKKRAKLLIDTLNSDVSDFYRKLNGVGVYATANYKIPIIKYFDIDSLCIALLKLNPEQMSAALGALAARFNTRHLDVQKLEVDAMMAIKETLLNYAEKLGSYKHRVVGKKLKQRFNFE